MQVKTLLNRIEKFKSFVYGTVHLEVLKGSEVLVVAIKSRANGKAECSVCGERAPGRLPHPVSDAVVELACAYGRSGVGETVSRNTPFSHPTHWRNHPALKNEVWLSHQITVVTETAARA